MAGAMGDRALQHQGAMRLHAECMQPSSIAQKGFGETGLQLSYSCEQRSSKRENRRGGLLCSKRMPMRATPEDAFHWAHATCPGNWRGSQSVGVRISRVTSTPGTSASPSSKLAPLNPKSTKMARRSVRSSSVRIKTGTLMLRRALARNCPLDTIGFTVATQRASRDPDLSHAHSVFHNPRINAMETLSQREFGWLVSDLVATPTCKVLGVLGDSQLP